MITLFRNLRPTLMPKPHAWTLAFYCPVCGNKTSIDVTGEPAVHPIWKIDPSPAVLIDRIKVVTDLAAAWENNFDDVTIEPSMKDLPHPRQINCKAHFSVTKGHIIPG